MNWSYLWESFKTQVIDLKGYETILTGLKNTLYIALFGFIIGLIVGSIIAIIEFLPKSKISKIFKAIAKFYVGLFRGTPIVVQLLVAWYVLKPLLGLVNQSALIWGIFVFGLNSAAYMSEIIRGGINSIDKGQMEAGRSLGLSFTKTMVKIVLPQSFKNALPSIGNELVALVKETSVAGFITVVDLQVALKQQDTVYNPIICYLCLAIIYIVMVIILTLIIKLVEKTLARSDR